MVKSIAGLLKQMKKLPLKEEDGEIILEEYKLPPIGPLQEFTLPKMKLEGMAIEIGIKGPVIILKWRPKRGRRGR